MDPLASCTIFLAPISGSGQRQQTTLLPLASGLALLLRPQTHDHGYYTLICYPDHGRIHVPRSTCPTTVTLSSL